jgi:hypothetical protein
MQQMYQAEMQKRFEVIKALMMSILGFWIVSLSDFVSRLLDTNVSEQYNVFILRAS